jgi:hypothetical protein
MSIDDPVDEGVAQGDQRVEEPMSMPATSTVMKRLGDSRKFTTSPDERGRQDRVADQPDDDLAGEADRAGRCGPPRRSGSWLLRSCLGRGRHRETAGSVVRAHRAGKQQLADPRGVSLSADGPRLEERLLVVLMSRTEMSLAFTSPVFGSMMSSLPSTDLSAGS